jgi:multidrug efflux pump
MRVWIDPDRLASLNLSPGDVHAALRRNNYLAAVGQTKGNLVQVNILANTDLARPRSSTTCSSRSGTEPPCA